MSLCAICSPVRCFLYHMIVNWKGAITQLRWSKKSTPPFVFMHASKGISTQIKMWTSNERSLEWLHFGKTFNVHLDIRSYYSVEILAYKIAFLVTREVIQEDAEGSLQTVVDEISQRTKRRRWVSFLDIQCSFFAYICTMTNENKALVQT